eukprot:CCRYP_012973-RA/>CCRYP_012973-RA protein AED:0.32 eAED:0.32 QI:263/1/1/1/0.83/0.71/7/1564/581
MNANPSMIEKPSFDDVLKKLEKVSRIHYVASDDATKKQSSDQICDTRQASDEMRIEDKENRSARIDAPRTGLASPKLLHPLRTTGQQQKESDKIRSLSIQLRLMRQKGQRGHLKDADVTGMKTSVAGNKETKYEAVNGLAVQGKSFEEQEELAKHEEVVKQALRMASAATKLQSTFRGSMRRIKLLRSKEEEAALTKAATGISCAWRGFCCRREYIQTVRDVIVCQSLARRRSSKKRVELVRSELRINAATVIQSKWRAHATMHEFGKTQASIVKSQATVRMWLAVRRLKLLSREVSFALRRYYSDLGCKYVTAVDVTLSQPMVRLQQQLAACTDIQSKCGVLATRKCRLSSNDMGSSKGEDKEHMKANAATKLSSAWRRFHYEKIYNVTVRYVITCQSIIRRDLAVKKVEKLRMEHRRNCNSTRIQKQWRKFAGQKTFKQMKSAAIAIQATVRMWTAARRWKMLRQEILSAFMRFQSQGAYTLTSKDVAVCQSVIQHCSLSKAKTTKTNEDKAKCPKENTPSQSLTVDTANAITTLCNKILAEPGVETDSHDFAMIYMSMISPEADVEAIYLSPRSKDEN